MQENVATVLETVAGLRGDAPALRQGEDVRGWSELDERASRLAAHLAAGGIGPESRVAIGMYNRIAYVESVLAILKLRAVPVNVNYRYREEELRFLLDDAGAEGMVLGPELAERTAACLPALPRLRTLVQTPPLPGEPDAEPPPGAVPYADALRAAPLPYADRGDDHWLLYTGGTTGNPKGVLARHSWLFGVCAANGYRLLGRTPPASLDEVRTAVAEPAADGPPLTTLVVSPLMHGTGIYNTLGSLLVGGTVVLTESRGFDPAEAAGLAIGLGVTDFILVGDVFARPLADELDRAEAAGEPHAMPRLRRMSSVGVTWSAEVKARLLRHGDFVCRDIIAASEGGPFAIAETRRGETAVTSRFVLFPGARVIDSEGDDVVPGSGVPGLLAAPTDAETGYQGDDAKTAQTFRMIGGRRFCVPGDMATLEPDGTLTLLGRGSRVINTGGEKVFAEEVEQRVLEHPAVRDAVVVGVPDERFGHRVVAVVVPEPGASLTEAELREHVGAALADYKRPRGLVLVPEVRRSPVGKADLGWAVQAATETGAAPDRSSAPTT
ncbi:MAG: AMP-binding protein [Streptosporangiales bacterium]|nr:AMP-binding protein [Streptosporangiales bacterium]